MADTLCDFLPKKTESELDLRNLILFIHLEVFIFQFFTVKNALKANNIMLDCCIKHPQLHQVFLQDFLISR